MRKQNGFFYLAIVSFSLVGLFISVGVVAAEDMMDLYQLALEQDPRFQGSTYQRKASQEKLNQAYANFYPTISFNGSYKYSRQDIVSSDNAVFGTGETDFGTQDYTLRLTQPLFNYSYFLELDQAKSVIRRSDAELEVARQELILRIVESYLTALAAKDNLTFAQAEEDIVKQHLDAAEARYEAGLIPVTDLYDAKARHASVEAQRVEAESLFDDALQGLKEMVGESIVDLDPLNPDMPLVSPDPEDPFLWVGSALEQNRRAPG